MYNRRLGRERANISECSFRGQCCLLKFAKKKEVKKRTLLSLGRKSDLHFALWCRNDNTVSIKTRKHWLGWSS